MLRGFIRIVTIYFLLHAIFICCKTRNAEKFYYTNGTLKAYYELRDGVRHGKGFTYYKSGDLQNEYFFDNGLKMGESTWYYQDGTIGQRVIYRKDTLVKSAIFRKDGTLEQIRDFNTKGQLIDFTCYLDSGKIDPDPHKKYPIIVPEKDTVKKGDIYRAEIRLGHRSLSSIYVFLGDTIKLGEFSGDYVKRIYKEVSLLEIDTDTCKFGLNNYSGQIFETCDTCQGYGWVGPFKYNYFVLPP